MSAHISQQFNAELDTVRNQVMTMGGLVETHVQDACTALVDGDVGLAERIVEEDFKVNALEVTIDEQCTNIIARRQPTAGDLRLVMMIVKTITDLERIGDEAEKVAKMALALQQAEQGETKHQYVEIRHLGDHVTKMLHDALDAFARMDVEAAIKAASEDEKIDQEYDAITRQLITRMMEDPRSIQRGLNVLWAARALERIGDHAKNISEYVIYLVKGKDVRHVTLDQMKKEALESR
ncbi:MAG: phosphate signaling complex protein PhoU [Gammaproteobacteria bacterium]|nr:phosphate signaling complex protein PhoU [Gammaproteobacteria bacterium]